MGLLVYEVNVAKISAASDVVERHLRVTVDGVEGACVHLPRETVKVGGLKFKVGAKVRLELRDVDEAGNHSEPAVVDFEVHDTIAPAAPLGFGVRIVGEAEETPDPLNAIEAHDKVAGKAGEGKPARPAPPKHEKPAAAPPMPLEPPEPVAPPTPAVPSKVNPDLSKDSKPELPKHLSKEG